MNDDTHWKWHAKSTTESTPLVLHVDSPHRPDGVLGERCVECMEVWPCTHWEHLRTLALTILNLPPEQLYGLARAARDIHQAARDSLPRPHQQPHRKPVDLQSARARKRQEKK